MSADVRVFFTWLSLLCMKSSDNTKYCVLGWQQLAANNLPIDQALPLYCNECTLRFIWRLFTVSTDPAQRIELGQALLRSEFMCQKNWNNDYCLPLLMSDPFLNDTKDDCAAPLIGWYGSNAQPCGADCASTLRAGKSRLGCCFGTFFSLLDYQNKWEPEKYDLAPITPTDVRGFVSGKCGVGIPWGCAAQEVTAVILLKNFNTTYYQAHKEDVDAILNATFAYVLAINAVKITLMQIENASPQDFGYPLLAVGSDSTEGLKATITVTPTSNDETTRVVAALKSSNDQQSANFVLSQLPLSAKADPAQPMTTITASSSTVDTPTSAGSSTFASFSLLLLLLLVCFF